MDRRTAFAAVYREKIFGDLPGERFYSGDGSMGRFADVYCQQVEALVNEKGIRSIVDLGCGDFRVGARIAYLVEEYKGIDIVPDLIEHHRREYGSANISFDCLDIVEDPLPPGDLCLIRQVFQHLGNAEISAVLAKLVFYKWVLVTEDVPAGKIKFPNVDHIHGPRTRLVEDSGVFLTEPPFSVRAERTWEDPYDGKSVLLSVLIQP
ncbi:MAG TPA: class I SAM-dependent methyltransferase [Bryobacteraceae bacterium]|nr:class I SAM-dependent methyltransferase [Bryobacteraceae bacterium]